MDEEKIVARAKEIAEESGRELGMHIIRNDAMLDPTKIKTLFVQTAMGCLVASIS